MKRMEDDSSYADAVRETAIHIIAQGGDKPLLDAVREALTHEGAWENVVWNLLCDDSGFCFEHEDDGQLLLDHGRAVPAHGTAIGKAAQKFLHDPRLQTSRWGEAVQWLSYSR
jgi:hypothetical protein